MILKQGVLLTHTLVGLRDGGAGPGSVKVEGLAAFAVDAGRVVATVAGEAAVLVGGAASSVAVTFAASADGEVGQRVVVALPGLLVALLVPVRVEPIEDHLDISGCHPVLQHRRVVEVVRRRPALERAEGHARAAQRVDVAVGVRAQRFLLVGARDDGARRFGIDLLALARVELEGHPGSAVVGALEYRHRVRSRRAELQTHVGEFVLFPQGERQGDVLRELHEGLGHPAGQIVGVVQIGEIIRSVASFRVIGVADEAVAHHLAFLVRRRPTVA